MIEFVIGVVVGLVCAVLMARFLPSKWLSVQQSVNEKVDDLTKKG
jgi:uncharacterized membrane-anchored protein YhcB (DUF1043 family)